MDNIFVKHIFAAVFEKNVLDPLLAVLGPEEVKFWGTKGTADYLRQRGFSAQSVVAGFDFDGRLKTISRELFARILVDRSKKSHLDNLKGEPFDLVVVDLYRPDKKNFPESMDIGGQALIRAAIKNYQNVALAFDRESVSHLVKELKARQGSTLLTFRRQQAKAAAKFIAERTQIEADFLNEL